MTTETAHFYGPVDLHGNALLNAGSVPTCRVDVFANRGSVVTYSGTYFFATDDPTSNSTPPNYAPGSLYYSNGTTWVLIASPKNEIFRLQTTSTSSTSSGTSGTDITGLTGTIVLATDRAVDMILKGPIQNSAADQVEAQIYDASNSLIKGRCTFPAAAVTANIDLPCDVWVPLDLTAGTWNFKIRIQSANTGTGKFTPTSANPLTFAMRLA